MLTPSVIMRKPFSLSLILLLGVMMVVSCSDDKDYPSLITDFVVARTNASGTVSSVSLDGGGRYDVSAQAIASSSKDTLLRCIASYTLEGDKMQLYNIAHVFSSRPRPAEDIQTVVDSALHLDTLPRDPLKVVSLWRGGGYINIHLGLMTTGSDKHSYAFSEDSTGHYSLVHHRPADDAESYTRQVYMSMPIPDSVTTLTFSVPTYEGIYTRTF